MNTAVHRFCAWSGVMYIVTFLVALVFIADMIPPTPPSWTQAQVVDFYHSHSLSIRVATALIIFAVPLGFSWTALMAIWSSRAEGKFPVMAWAQLVCGVWSFGGAYIGAVDWSVAAFRPERAGDVLYMLSDHGWYWMIMPGSCAVMQCVFIGIGMLSDRRAEPIFPRWVGFFNIWVGVLQIPGVMMAFFHTGPFAWNGLFAFWIPVTVFSLWIYVDTWAVLRAIKREKAGQIKEPA